MKKIRGKMKMFNAGNNNKNIIDEKISNVLIKNLNISI